MTLLKVYNKAIKKLLWNLCVPFDGQQMMTPSTDSRKPRSRSNNESVSWFRWWGGREVEIVLGGTCVPMKMMLIGDQRMFYQIANKQTTSCLPIFKLWAITPSEHYSRTFIGPETFTFTFSGKQRSCADRLFFNASFLPSEINDHDMASVIVKLIKIP